MKGKKSQSERSKFKALSNLIFDMSRRIRKYDTMFINTDSHVKKEIPKKCCKNQEKKNSLFV